MVAQGSLFEFGDHSVEIVATPLETGDRYELRIVAEPGGGPGIRGAGPHVHPKLTETFVCSSGLMTARLGRELIEVGVGERLEVPPGEIHGFVNSGTDSLVLDAQIIYEPPGMRPENDLMAFGAIYAGLVRDGRVGKRSGEPSMLQMAVLMEAYREAIQQPGVQATVLKALAVVGRLPGYGSDFPQYTG